MSVRSRLVIAACIAMGLGAAVALAADADLQQYNGAPAFSADLTSASTLLVRDGKKISADNNASGYAPVNRALKQLKDMLIGVHDGVFGSRSGSQLRTVRALEADGTGGQAETNTDGQIRASIGFESKDPSNGTAHLNHTRLRFTKSASSGTNPAYNLGLNNELRAVLVPKMWAIVTTDGAGGSATSDGANFAGAIVGGAVGTKLRLLFASPMASAIYNVQSTCFVGSTAVASGALLGDRHTSSIDLAISGHDASAEAMTCDVLVMGRQDTP